MAGYGELAAIAASVGIRHGGAASLAFSRGGFRVHVSLQLNSGTVEGIYVSVARSGLPDVTLRLEDTEDRKGKERGLSVEVQTGDASFDETVYIETDAPDAVIQGLLAAPATRKAVLELLGWRSSVQLSPEGVALTAGDQTLFDPEMFARVLGALLVLAAVPAVPFSPFAGEDPSRLLPVLLAGIAAPVMFMAMVGALALYTPDVFWLPLAGAGSGIAAALALRPLLARLVRGHSRSHRHFRILAWLAALELAALGTALVVGLNGALDTSPRDRRVGRVSSAKHYVDEGHKTKFVVRWDDGHTESHIFSDEHEEIHEGDPVTLDLRRGRFGARWVQKDVTVHVGTEGKILD